VCSFHDGALQDVTIKKGVVQKPVAVLDYAQLQSYKMARERFRKYYQKIFRYMLDTECLNTHIGKKEVKCQKIFRYMLDIECLNTHMGKKEGKCLGWISS
jgi:hypothetical protein